MHRTRRHPERQVGREPFDARPRSGEQHVFGPEQLEEPLPLGRDQALQIARADRDAAVRGSGREDAHVVEAEVAIVVRGAVERHLAIGEHVLICPQMERLGIGEHAVEVEDDAEQRHLSRVPILEPRGLRAAALAT